VSNHTTRPPARTPRSRSTSTRPEPSRPATSRAAGHEKLTLAELCAELKISRSTFYDWRAKGRAPECFRLPNGDLRILRSDLDTWLQSCREAD
jgi:predicted DNA-binding transcriptional regulator AlpA